MLRADLHSSYVAGQVGRVASNCGRLSMIESALQSHKADPTSQGPRVLVGIVTRNRSEILPDAIESALSQNCPRVEVAVLDDGSQDRTFELRHKYRGVQWYRWSSSRGYLEARNHLMRHTDAEFYLSLDDDARFVTGDEISVAVKLSSSQHRRRRSGL